METVAPQVVLIGLFLNISGFLQSFCGKSYGSGSYIEKLRDVFLGSSVVIPYIFYDGRLTEIKPHIITDFSY